MKQLIAFGSVQRYLAAALQNFTKCHQVEVRDFDSRTKQRDDGIWYSYGMKTWRDRGGAIRPHWDRGYARGVTVPSMVFGQVLRAIADSGVNCTYLGHVTRHDPNALQDNAFAVDAFQIDGVRQALAKLTSITLACKPAAPHRVTSQNECDNLKKLVKYMKNVTRVRINGDLVLRVGSDGTFDALVECLVELLEVAQVTQLELGKLTFWRNNMTALVNAMKNSGKIEQLTMFRVSHIYGQALLDS